MCPNKATLSCGQASFPRTSLLMKVLEPGRQLEVPSLPECSRTLVAIHESSNCAEHSSPQLFRFSELSHPSKLSLSEALPLTSAINGCCQIELPYPQRAPRGQRLVLTSEIIFTFSSLRFILAVMVSEKEQGRDQAQ